MSARDELMADMEPALFTDSYYGDMFRDGYTRGGLADVLLAAGYRKPRTITTEAELKKLPIETVIRTAHGEVRQRNSLGYWYAMGDEDVNGIPFGAFPATVLYEPEVAA